MAEPSPVSSSRTIRRRLSTLFAVLVVTLVVIGAASAVFAIAAVRSGEDRLVTMVELARLVDEALDPAVADQLAVIETYARTRDIAYLDDLEHAEHAAIEATARLIAYGDPEVAQRARAAHESLEAWWAGYAEPVAERVRFGYPVGAATAAEGERLAAAIKASLEALDELVAARQDEYVAATRLSGLLGIGGLLAALAATAGGLLVLWRGVLRSVNDPIDRLIADIQTAESSGHADFDVGRQDEIGELARTLDRLHASIAGRYEVARIEAERAELFNLLGERISFAESESELIDAGVEVLRRLIPDSSGSLLLLNSSGDHLTAAATWGQAPFAAGTRLEGSIDECPGVRRGSAHVTLDVEDAVRIRCRIHPVVRGSQLCLPMLALGDMVGVLHVTCESTVAVEHDHLRQATRLAEQLALALANTRLVRTMERLAMTDPLTGLGNARHFERELDRQLAAAEADGRNVGLIFLDLDNFKDFNDTYGHPAGDEALRTFGRVLMSVVRDGDLVSRYGGEEFVVALRDCDLETAGAVAEKIRLAIEQLVVRLGPGRFGRITASLGVASTDTHGFDGRSLLRVSDRALYAAKEGGRNRVILAEPQTSNAGYADVPLDFDRRSPVSVSGRRRRRRGRGPSDEIATGDPTAPAGSLPADGASMEVEQPRREPHARADEGEELGAVEGQQLAV